MALYLMVTAAVTITDVDCTDVLYTIMYIKVGKIITLYGHGCMVTECRKRYHWLDMY